MFLVLGKVISIFLLIAVGFVVGRLGVLPTGSREVLNAVLLKVVAPCLIIASITSKELTDDTFTITVQIMLITAIFCILASALGFFLAKKIFKIRPLDDIGLYAFAFASLNCGFLGFPVTLALFGQDIFYLMVMENVMTIVYFYVCGPLLLNMTSAKSSEVSKKKSFDWKSIVCNPNLVASVFSIIMLFSGLHLPDMLFESVDTLGDATIPLSMLIVGIQLSESNLMSILKDRKLLGFSLTKMLMLPLLTFLSVNWLPLSSSVKICAIMASVFPVAVVVAPISDMEGKNASAASALIVLTTFISIATIPIFASGITHFYLA